MTTCCAKTPGEKKIESPLMSPEEWKKVRAGKDGWQEKDDAAAKKKENLYKRAWRAGLVLVIALAAGYLYFLSGLFGPTLQGVGDFVGWASGLDGAVGYKLGLLFAFAIIFPVLYSIGKFFLTD